MSHAYSCAIYCSVRDTFPTDSLAYFASCFPGGSIVGQPQLWFVKGVDVNDERTHAGRVNWELMRRLQRFAGVTDIGLLSFAKLITKILISMPIYRSLGYCQTPMPASIM